MRNIMLNGPSLHERKFLWLEISGAASRIKEFPNYYEQIIGTVDNCDFYSRQIAKDLHRTFPHELDMHKFTIKTSL
jgi:hypothetical protein